MREARRNYFVTGAFVLSMLVVLVLWLALLAGRTGASDRYEVHFEDVMGLSEGAEVRFQGYPVGLVERIEPAAEGGFVLELAVKRGWQIPEDSVARITTSGLLSSLVVNVETGVAARALASGDRIASAEGADLFAELGTLAGDLSSLVRRVDPAVESLAEDLPEILSEVRAFVARLGQSAARIQALLSEENTGRIEAILTDVGTASSNLATLSAELGRTQGRIDAVLARVEGIVARGGPEFEAALVDLHDSLDAVARHADAIAYNLEATSRNLNEFSGQLRRNPSVLLRGRDEEAAP